jgi:hypothetical protein
MRLAERIRRKIDRGQLPLTRPRKVLAGFGDRIPCSGCGKPIYPAQVRWTVQPDGARAVPFHIGCFGLWDAELRRRGVRPE